MTTWGTAWAVTVAVEVPLAVAIVRDHARATVAAAALAANLLSHPLFTFGLLRWLPGPFLARLAVGEGVVIALEAAIYRATLRNLSAGRALALAATLNAASYLVGLAVLNGPV